MVSCESIGKQHWSDRNWAIEQTLITIIASINSIAGYSSTTWIYILGINLLIVGTGLLIASLYQVPRLSWPLVVPRLSLVASDQNHDHWTIAVKIFRRFLSGQLFKRAWLASSSLRTGLAMPKRRFARRLPVAHACRTCSC